MKLRGTKARYVRLHLAGKTYLHLDEVEVYAVGSARNVALGKPATQSSVSPWSAAHRRGGVAPGVSLLAGAGSPTIFAAAAAIERGLRLADDLQRRGVAVAAERQILESIGRRLEELPARVPEDVPRQLYFQALGRAEDGAAEPALGFRPHRLREAGAGQFSARFRPALRLVVAARRRNLHSGGLQERSPAAAVPQRGLSAGQLRGPRPLVRRHEAAGGVLQILSASGPREAEVRQGEVARGRVLPHFRE